MSFYCFRSVHLVVCIVTYIQPLSAPKGHFSEISFPRSIASTTRQQSQHRYTHSTTTTTHTLGTMGLQRTPPPGKAPLARENEAGPSNQAGNTSLPSPSQAFAPRNPRVMRSPQSGSTHASSSTSSRPAAAPVTHPEPRSTIPAAPTTPAPSQYLQPMDEGNVSTTPLTAPPAPALVAPTPIHQQSVEEAQDLPMEEIIEPIQLAPPTTPAPKRRKSRHHSKAPPPIPDEAGDAPTESVQSTTIHTQAGVVDYGERHRRMLETLQIAVTSSSQKMT
jgi:hypothetical protein